MVKKMLVILFSLLLLAVGVVGAQDAIPADLDLSGTTVVYWHQFSSDPQLAKINELAARFNETNEYGITVEALAQGSYTDLRSLMNAGIVAGELPNLVAGYQNDAASYFEDGAAVDLNRYYSDANWGYSAEEQADFNQGLIAINTFANYDGALLAWPNLISANVLSVNLTMLEQLGFDGPPASKDQLIEISCAAANSDLTGAEGAEVLGYPIKADSSNFESYVASFGGDIFDYEAGTYNFLSDESIAALQMYADLYSQGCAYIPDTRFGNTDEFALGWNPMALGSSAGVPFILGGFANSGVEAEWIITTTPPLVEGEQSALNVFLPSLIMVAAPEEEQLATWLFIQYLSSPEVQAEWTAATAYLPSRLSVAGSVADILNAEDPQYPYLIALNDLLNGGEVRIAAAPKGVSYNGVRDLVAQAVANVTANGMDVMEAAQQLQDAANALLEELGS